MSWIADLEGAQDRARRYERALREIASIPAVTPRGEGRDRVSVVTSGRRYIEIAEKALGMNEENRRNA